MYSVSEVTIVEEEKSGAGVIKWWVEIYGEIYRTAKIYVNLEKCQIFAEGDSKPNPILGQSIDCNIAMVQQRGK